MNRIFLQNILEIDLNIYIVILNLNIFIDYILLNSEHYTLNR